MAPNELRRDRRYFAPPVAVLFGADRYPTRNWSLGGFLLDGTPPVKLGTKISCHLVLDGRTDRFEMLAEALRRNEADGTLACRFIEPSPAAVAALDAAVAERFLRRKAKHTGAAMAIAGALLAMSASANAAGTGGALVPGAAPLPEFRINFPNLLIEPMGPPTPGDLSISLTSPDKGVIQFLFSPRSQFGTAEDPETGTSSSYAGLSWNLFDNGGFFGNLGLAGSLTRPGVEDQFRNWRYFGPPLALHSTFEIGYQLGEGHSLTLSLDRASEPSMLSDHNELDNFRLRYGLKF